MSMVGAILASWQQPRALGWSGNKRKKLCRSNQVVKWKLSEQLWRPELLFLLFVCFLQPPLHEALNKPSLNAGWSIGWRSSSEPLVFQLQHRKRRKKRFQSVLIYPFTLQDYTSWQRSQTSIFDFEDNRRISALYFHIFTKMHLSCSDLRTLNISFCAVHLRGLHTQASVSTYPG